MSILASWSSDPLGSLLGAPTAERFFHDVFEQRYYVAEGETRDRFDGLVTLADIDRIVTSTDLKDGDLVVADAARDNIDKSSYVDDSGFVDRGAVAKLYRTGGTIILNQAQRIIPALGQLCQGLEHVFSSHIQTNLYLTPAGAQGFKTHFDNHDVFIIQVHGEKLWRLYGVPLDLPFRGERFSSGEHDVGDLRHEFVLRAGDCVYVPRGMMHDAQTSGDDPSLHITVGMIAKTWADLILEAVSEVALKAPEFRRTLPPGYAQQNFDRTEARHYLKSLGQILADQLQLDPSMDLLPTGFIRSRPASNRGGITAAHVPIGADERFARTPLAPYRLGEDTAAGQVILFGPGSELFFTPESKPALDRALDGHAFTQSDLNFEHAEIIIRRLLDYGLISRI